MLKLENVSYNYGSFRAVENINFEVNEGDFLGLVGEDEAGKTTLLHIIAGLQTRYEGTVSLTKVVDEVTVPLELRRVRFVTDDIIDEEKVTGKKYLEYMRKTSDEYDVEMQDALCEMFGINIEEILLEMTYQDNKLVQLIAAICAKPQLLILDEPFNFLSKAAYYKLMDYVKKLNDDGMTVIVAVEKFEHIRFYCNSYVYLYEGEVKASGKVAVDDVYPKVVTVSGDDDRMLGEKMDRLLFSRYGRDVYLYEGKISALTDILKSAGCLDWMVEEVTLEEQIHMDFTRWE